MDINRKKSIYPWLHSLIFLAIILLLKENRKKWCVKEVDIVIMDGK